MAKYLLLARDEGNWHEADISPAEIEAILARYNAWSSSLAEKGHLLSGEKLTDGQGRVLRGAGDAMRISDGPHTESKEVVGGFWILQAESYEQVVRLSADCPHLEHGALEIREIEAM